MKLVFFHTPRPRQFHYSARYFDEEKDRLEQRRKELGLSSDETTGDIRVRMDAAWKKFSKGEKRAQKKSDMGMLVYILLVILLIYFIFFR